jgi:hypothetical protein
MCLRVLDEDLALEKLFPECDILELQEILAKEAKELN